MIVGIRDANASGGVGSLVSILKLFAVDLGVDLSCREKERA
jgi:hypothetical protein